MLTESQKEMLCARTLGLLGQVGMRVENDKIESDMLKMGCSRAVSGRITVPPGVIQQFVSSQRKTQVEDAEKELFLLRFGVIDWGHFLFWTGKVEEEKARMALGVRTSIFDCGPTRLYDYPTGEMLPVDTDIFLTMKKWAHTVPEIGYVSTWYRQDVPPEIERIDSLVLALKHTNKVGGIEAIYPEHIKYLQAIGEIITGKPGETAYICGSQCVTPPLIFDKRSAAETVERAKRKVGRFHVASMMTVGLNTPVTPASAAVMMGAEILGGMVAVFSQDPSADITGRMLASVVDMRNAQVNYATSECTVVNIAVKELFDAFWGGHLRVDPFFTTIAKRPGLHAVAECAAAARRFAALTGISDIGYPGVGSLDSGGVGSPTQAVLDLEIRKSEFLPSSVAVDDESVPFAEICERVQSEKDFFTSDHTLSHYRELTSSPVFRTEAPVEGGWAGDEKAILDACDASWRQDLARYEPPAWPEDKLKAMDEVVRQVKREMLGV